MKLKLMNVERNDRGEGSEKGVNTLTFKPTDVEVAGEFKTVPDEARRVASETNRIACPNAIKDVCLLAGSSPNGSLVMDNMSDADADRFTVGSEYDLS